MVVLAFAMVLYSNAMVKNVDRRQIENDDDPFAELQDDNDGDEELNTVRRKSSQCEPCGSHAHSLLLSKSVSTSNASNKQMLGRLEDSPWTERARLDGESGSIK